VIGVRILAVAIIASVALGACAAAPRRIEAMEEMERVRSARDVEDGARIAPEAYARAEQERELSREARASADELGATLHAERAIAAYQHALAVARLARGAAELADAQKSLDDAMAQQLQLEASRSQLEREADELEQRVRIERERKLPASSLPTTPEREAARWVAAQSLATQARLLCSAARLVLADAPGLTDAEKDAASVSDRLAKRPRPAPIDDAARARARCLDVLTRARRGGGYDATAADGLLAELSAAGGWDPMRDERGVIVTLHEAFRGAELTQAAASRLQELGRVAAAHPRFAVQVVVHDARTAASDGEAADAKRAAAAVQALVRGGASDSHLRAELAGARVPIVDPSDVAARGRNERLEVVFVGGG
jgi:hypothetical protein